MECQLCKTKEATVHLTQIIDDEMKKLDLCEGCAKQKGVTDPTGFQLAELLHGAGAGAGAEVPAPEPVAGLRCERCGLGQAEFKKTGRLGCSDCYDIFGEMLDGVLKGMHKGIRHRGKVPASAVKTEGPKDLLERLSVEMQAAIAREDFEQAARLRDQIRAAKTASGL